MEKVLNKVVLNRWNNRKYLVVEQKDSMVTLERDDGTRLTIEAKEFQFNYKEQKPKGVDKVN